VFVTIERMFCNDLMTNIMGLMMIVMSARYPRRSGPTPEKPSGADPRPSDHPRDLQFRDVSLPLRLRM